MAVVLTSAIQCGCAPPPDGPVLSGFEKRLTADSGEVEFAVSAPFSAAGKERVSKYSLRPT